MKKYIAFFLLLLCFLTFADAKKDFVCYSDFGAAGDGITDDQAAIARAHEYANKAGLPVRAEKDKRYYIGPGTKIISICTNTDFGNAQFIIDDRQVKDRTKPIFVVKSLHKPVRVPRPAMLKASSRRIPGKFPGRCLVTLYDKNTKRFIRYGSNANAGLPQTDVVIVDKEGNIDPATPLIWDFDNITGMQVAIIDGETLYITGGVFTTIANAEKGPHKYYSRNMIISRSNVIVDGLKHLVKEPDFSESWPYAGFIVINKAAFITIKNTVFTGRKQYFTVKPNSRSRSTGTYDINLSSSVYVKFINCSQSNDINDRRYWGIMGSNYCKNLTYDNCRLSRFDAHMGVYNATIRNSRLGHQGISVTGYGTLRVEKTTVYSHNLVSLRQDYGSFWRGNIILHNNHLISGNRYRACMIGGKVAAGHDFGYQCTLPEKLDIKNITVDDSQINSKYAGVVIFSDFFPLRKGKTLENIPFKLPQSVSVENLSTVSGKPWRLSPHKALFASVEVIEGQSTAR